MALINRMSRLFTADMHAVLDRLEEPDALLRHAIREMEEELARSEQESNLLAHERASLADRQRKVAAALVELAEQLGVAFDAGNEQLARRLIKRKLETERLTEHVVERLAAIEKALTERQSVLAEQRERLDVMRQKAQLLTESDARPGTPEDWSKTDFAVGEDEVEVAFLREQQRRARS